MSVVATETIDGTVLVTPVPVLAHRGRRYEVVDGTLVATPAPSARHQAAVLALATLLHAHAPRDLLVLPAPFEVRLGADTVVQPDLVVVRAVDVGGDEVPGPPLLAVEVLAPETRRLDRTLRHALHEEAGTAAYWVFDPVEGRLVAWEFRGGGYVEVADVSGDEAFAATVPFPVTVTPAALVGA
jgi:Uma2 family endonuclease